MQRVISELFETYRGKPALVIGGGPSVLVDLPTLPVDFRPSLVLSANEHGTKQDRFAVDFIVNCDKIHCMRHEPMEPFLRQFGVSIINRWSWADVRLEDWTFSGNSGTTSVAVAAALGCSPIVVTGIDFWSTGRRYFHDPVADLPPARRTYAWQRNAPTPITKPDKRLGKLWDFCGEAHIRPMSGPMTTRWKKFHPGEIFGAPPVIAYARRTFGTAPYRAVRGFPFGNSDIVQAGTVLQLTKREAEHLLRAGKVAHVSQAE
jgi:hypothetical protein